MNRAPRGQATLSRWLVLMAGLIALAAVAVVTVRSAGSPLADPPAPAPSAEGVDEIGDMRAGLQLLRRQVALMAEQRVSQSAERSLSAGHGSSDPAEASVGGLAPVDEADEAARDRRRFAALAGKLDAQAVDPAWAPATERLITETLSKSVFAGSTLLGATCRSTMCRLEVGHESEEHRRRFASTLPTRLPSLPSGSMRNGEGDAFTTIVYVAREGHRIPRDEGP